MITGKINLAKFEHFLTQVPNKSGQKEECIVIPIKRNSLIRTDKGNVFFDIAAFEVAPEKRKGEDTHLVSQSFDKDTREKMKASGQNAPILGNLRDWNQSGGGEQSANTSNDFSGAAVGDDLPF